MPVLSHDAKWNSPDLGKLGQTPKEEHKSLVCEPGRAEQTGHKMERELGRTERKMLCTSVLDTRGSWGRVGLVLRAEKRLWRSKG